MPRVTLINSEGSSTGDSGGCFGFAGRSGNTIITNRLTQHPIETFRYHVGEGLQRRVNATGLNDPKPYLNWLATESPWAKYIQELHEVNNELVLDIKTDIPGHCVIGTASAARLAVHRPQFIQFWNMCCTQFKGNGAIAMLVFYSLFRKSLVDFTVNDYGVLSHTNVSSNQPLTLGDLNAKLGLGDDEVMVLDRVNGGMINSFIAGDFEMIRNDRNEDLYKDTYRYNQDILNSYVRSGETFNFAEWLIMRFHTGLTAPTVTRSGQRSSGSMGSSTSQRPRLERQCPLYLSSLIGWVQTLSTEYRTYGHIRGI